MSHHIPHRDSAGRFANRRDEIEYAVRMSLCGVLGLLLVGAVAYGLWNRFNAPITPVDHVSPVSFLQWRVMANEKLIDIIPVPMKEVSGGFADVLAEAPVVTPYVPEPKPTKTINVPADTEWVVKIIEEKAAEYGVSTILMKAIAVCESGFRPEAKAKTSSATGVYQYIKATWLGYAKQRGLDWTLADREDAYKNIDMTGYVLARGGLSNWTADPRSEDCWGWARNK